MSDNNAAQAREPEHTERSMVRQTKAFPSSERSLIKLETKNSNTEPPKQETPIEENRALPEQIPFSPYPIDHRTLRDDQFQEVASPEGRLSLLREWWGL